MIETVGEPPSIEQLVLLLASASRPATGYTGVFSEFESGELRRRCRVWLLRDLARIEDPPGQLSLLAADSFVWSSATGDGVKLARRNPDNPVSFDLGPLPLVDVEDYWREWLGLDPELATRTLHQVDHRGRPAWRLQAPFVKGGSPTLTVDAETGLIVRFERADIGFLLEWSCLAVDPSLDSSFFNEIER